MKKPNQNRVNSEGRRLFEGDAYVIAFNSQVILKLKNKGFGTYYTVNRWKDYSAETSDIRRGHKIFRQKKFGQKRFWSK